VVVWLVLFCGGPAAAEPSTAEIAVARRLFREATELRQAEKWDLAAQKLREAIALKETPGLRFHLAHCEEKLGRLVEAQVEYDRADELISAGAKAPDVLPLLEAARAALRERVPTLRILLSAEPANVHLAIDGVPLSPRLIGEAVPLNPGEHHVQLDAEGRAPVVFTVRLEEGEERSLEAAVGDPPLPPAPPTKPAPARPRAEAQAPGRTTAEGRSAGFGVREGVLVGEGVLSLAGAGLGVYFLIERGEAGDRVDAAAREVVREDPGPNACGGDSPPSACAELRSAANGKQRSGEWAIGSFVGAGVGAAAFVTTWLLWPPRASERGTSRVLFVPVVRGAAVVGQF